MGLLVFIMRSGGGVAEIVASDIAGGARGVWCVVVSSGCIMQGAGSRGTSGPTRRVGCEKTRMAIDKPKFKGGLSRLLGLGVLREAQICLIRSAPAEASWALAPSARHIHGGAAEAR